MAQSDAFQRFYADAALHAPGAIASTLQPELFATLRDFLQKTNVWIEQIPVFVVPDTYDYEIVPPAGTAFNRLMAVSDPQIRTNSWAWPATFVPPTTLRLTRNPTQPANWDVWMALFAVDPVDVDGNPVFPEWMLDKFFDTLFSGMLYRVLMQPQKPYSNAGLAATRYKMYVQGRAQALAEVQHGYGFDMQSWQFPAAGVTRSRQRGV